MNILITGARGFVGRNLTEALRAVRDGRDRTRGVEIGELFLFDTDTDPALLPDFCRRADFVFHLAGVNRPRDPSDFMRGNLGFTTTLLDTLEAVGNPCPVMLSSSVQATLVGRYAEGDYGRSKRAGEDALFAFGERTGARVLVYRFPNLFGKWCRPNYNSAVATFCHNIARGLPITVSDPAVCLTLLYIDDLVDEMFCALRGEAHRCEFDGVAPIAAQDGSFCYAPITHEVTLGEITDWLSRFAERERTLLMPKIPKGSFAAKLYATYLSYLPPEAAAVPLAMHEDARGSFTELMRTADCGQISVNISRPGITKGQHWHNTKWEYFVVVAGEGVIRQRRLNTDEVIEHRVNGHALTAVRILPGYTHNIENLSETENLVTVMWANECFDPTKPDTFFEEV